MIFVIFHWKSYVLVKYNPIRIPIFPEKRDPRPAIVISALMCKSNKLFVDEYGCYWTSICYMVLIIYYQFIEDPKSSDINHCTWCITSYPSIVMRYNQMNIIFNYVIPFLVDNTRFISMYVLISSLKTKNFFYFCTFSLQSCHNLSRINSIFCCHTDMKKLIRRKWHYSYKYLFLKFI